MFFFYYLKGFIDQMANQLIKKMIVSLFDNEKTNFF